MKFPEFNRRVNPNDEKCYIAKTFSGISQPSTFAEIANIAANDPTTMVEWIIPKGYCVLEIKEPNVLPLFESKGNHVMVMRLKKSYYIFCRGPYDRTTMHNMLACGISANTYAYSKNGTSILLPFRNKTNANELLKEAEVLYSNGIEEHPLWLKPLRKISSSSPDGLELPIQNNTTTILVNHLGRLKGLNKFEQLEILHILNNEFALNPVSADEIKQIVSITEENLLRQFMDKDKFFHNKLGDYVIEACTIKRDRATRELFYYDEKKGIYVNDPQYLMGYMTKLCPQLKDYQKIEVMKYINNYLFDESVDFNKNPFTIVFKNGILNLADMKFESMSTAHLESIQIAANYNPDAYSKTVDEYFETATSKNKSIETLLYEAIGYAMLKTNELQKVFMLVGSGRNGKSTFLDLIKAILGRGNYASISLKDLSSNFRASNLIGKLASLAGDISSQPIQDSDLVKSIAAGEDITLEVKYKDPTTERLFSTLFFACNRLPKTPDTTEGFYRRWVIVPFHADLTKVSAVDGMRFLSRLTQEQASIDYAAYKAVQAIYNVLENTRTFTEPQEVKAVLDNYKIDNSSLLSWFREELNNSKEQLIKKNMSEIYLSYSQWCEQSGRMKMSRTNLRQQISSDIGVEIPN